MFYEENQIRFILNCDKCNKPYDRALVLPCKRKIKRKLINFLLKIN